MTRPPARMRRRSWVLLFAAAVLGLTWGAATITSPAGATPSGTDDADTTDSPDSATDPDSAGTGADLFGIHCSSCHGPAGEGIDGSGPDIREEGQAAVDFVMRTGRMPLADPDLAPARGPVRFTDDEIEALVAYVGGFGDGPAIPDIDIDDGDVTNGGDIFRLNCAACHVASGAGAIIGSGRKAPELSKATPTEVAEAIVVGPGAMPVFGELTTQEVTDVAAYVAEMQEQGTTDVDSLGGIGPVAEGLVTWLLPLAALVAVTRWIGTSTETADPPQPDTGANR